MELLEGLLKWWPLVAAVAGQLVMLGAGIQMLRGLRTDFDAHRSEDSESFKEVRNDIRGVHRRIDNFLGGGHEL